MKPVLQPPPPLPKVRLSSDYFPYISNDASGPYDRKKCEPAILALYVNNTIRRKVKKKENPMDSRKKYDTKKVWIILVGCLIARNENLELVKDKSAEQLLMSFQRRCSENGQPTLILSDRASESIKAKDELEEIINSDNVKR